MGKFVNLFNPRSPNISLPAPPPLPSPAVESKEEKPTGPTPEAQEAAQRTRVAEKRRSGRRATIFASNAEEDLGSTVARPSARTPKVLFG